MNSIGENGIENLCRLCLGVIKTKMKINIFKDNFPLMIRLVSDLEVNRLDQLPKYSCLKCAKEVKSAALLRERILGSHRHLKAHLRKIDNEESTSDWCGDDPNSNFEEITIITELDESGDDKKQIKKEVENDSSENPNKDNTKKRKYSQIKEESRDDSDCNYKDGDIQETSDELEENDKQNSSLSPKKKARKKQTNVGRTCRGSKPPHICPTCNKTYSSRANLTMHRRTHNGPVDCPICGKTYKYKDTMNQHIVYFHKRDSNSGIVCETCGKRFRKKYLYGQHLKRHQNKKDVECETCGKKFFCLDHLARHTTQVHLSLKPHICTICQKSFPRKQQMMVHFRTHSAETPFNCELCPRKFKQRTCLRTHMKNIHNIEEKLTVYCPECEKGFVNEMAFSTHFSKVHEAEKCSECSSVFATKEYLINHIQKVHVKEDTK